MFTNDAQERVDELHLLGIHFFSDLYWKYHHDPVRRKLEIILCCKNLLPPSSIIQFYRYSIKIIAENGCPLNAGALKFLLISIEQIQNMAIKAGLVVLRDSLQTGSGISDAATMSVFYKNMHLPPFPVLSCIVTPFTNRQDRLRFTQLGSFIFKMTCREQSN